ncbi:DUF3179 domain-containing protein [Fodinibius salsisoli]|uniref:DUF3179 domain-containing protein n=1 Tax=Fodinibius salsisoli TaxID=2820877 RepID=A0ABT3PSG1_9BACT|nr:DUF3179 domain-containing protein [Fodinibius salsisoli]MCW9708782.1 DUF3179 domain-containing protein [Fodinibius salsisoli]
MDWLIPQEQVVSGGPGKDGIPSIDNPKFAPASEINYIPNDRRVIGIKIGNSIKAYPHQILDWHEIVNDQVGDEAVAITFCPLTGTAIGWNRAVGGTVTEFGVSGLLFRNNLIPYDRNSDSRWSQMQLRSVAGVLSGTTIETIDLIETSWATWKHMYPQSDVLTRETGFSRNYEGFAYGKNYSTSNSNILFPVQNPDNRLPNKDRVHGVLAQPPAGHGTIAKAYPINGFGDQIRVITDQVGPREIIVVGSAIHDFAASFRTTLEDGTQFTFVPVQNSLPVVMKDQEGNRWDIFGYAVEGPRQGERLTPTLSYTGYWFGWGDFFPDLEIYQ